MHFSILYLCSFYCTGKKFVVKISCKIEGCGFYQRKEIAVLWHQMLRLCVIILGMHNNYVLLYTLARNENWGYIFSKLAIF